MWGQPPDRGGLSPSFIIGLVLLMFILTADMSSWGNGYPGSSQQVRLGQQAQLQAQEVREKLLYELTLSNERLEKENRQLHQQLLVLRRLLRTCKGGAAGNRTAAATPHELAQMAHAELALASGESVPQQHKLSTPVPQQKELEAQSSPEKQAGSGIGT